MRNENELNFAEFTEFFFLRHFSKQQKVCCFLKTEPIFAHLPHQILHIVAAVPQLAVAGRLYAVHIFKRNNFRNCCKPSQDAFPVHVTKSAVYPVFFE